jgi:hypothetical protein
MATHNGMTCLRDAELFLIHVQGGLANDSRQGFIATVLFEKGKLKQIVNAISVWLTLLCCDKAKSIAFIQKSLQRGRKKEEGIVKLVLVALTN